ncbi:MAG: PAS domain S-box protein [Anaeromyxobacteraceae bacterium]
MDRAAPEHAPLDDAAEDPQALALRELTHAPDHAGTLLRAVSEALPDPVFVKDRAGRWVFANDATLRVVRRTAAQVMGKVETEIYDDAASAMTIMANDARIMASGVSESVEERIETGGRVRWFLSTKSPFRDARGEVVGLVGVSRDISARKRSEEARLAAERRLRTVLESLSEGVLVADATGRILSWNRAALDILGFEEERQWLVGLKELARTFELVSASGEVRAVEEWPLARVLRGEAVRNEVCEIRRRDLDWRRTLRFSGALTRGAGQQDLAVLSITDITERERAVEALRLSEARFRALIEKSSDLIVLYDADLRITYWGPAVEAAVGWTAGERLGRRGLSTVHPDDAEEAARVLEAIVAPGATVQTSLRIPTKAGGHRTLEIIFRNLLHDPDVRAIVSNGRDVTAQRSLEQQMRQAQKLESIGRLAGGVAHDFNNVLTVILSSASVMREDLAERGTVSSDDVKEIEDAGNRARELTRHLLAFARKSVLTPVVLDLGKLVLSGEKMLRRLIGEDVKLVVEVEPGLWNVHADPGAIDQALMNLVVNARDAMPDGGRLVVSLRNTRSPEGPPAAHAGDWVGLSVRDSGVGMPPDVVAHLFEPLFTTKEAGKGTGLGLATVHGIATQAGGHVHVESTPGQGSTFSICLPRCREDVAAAAPAAPRPSGQGTETVLVVEDDELVRTVAVRTLARAGYRVLEAAGGADAMAVAGRHPGPIDLVVTDVVLQGASGPEVAAALAALRPGLRVVYVSGHELELLSRRGVLATDVPFLAKPFSAEALAARVRAALDAPRG